jgi:hypothetical protein
MRAHPWLFIIVVAAGCRPDLGAPSSRVTGPRILAIQGDPAEAKPGQDVTYHILVATPDGTMTDPQVQWAVCTASKPLTENNVVSVECLGDAATAVGDPAASVVVTTPADACARFGPDVPPTVSGQPPFRPRDPDVTGGYYQPVRATLGTSVAFGLERITCNVAGASLDIAQQYRDRYVANTNPSLLPLTPAQGGQAVALDSLPAGTTVTFMASWTPESVETFPVYDPATQTLVDHREAVRVSWFATGGNFSSNHTGRTEAEPDTTTSNEWTAPAEPGAVHLWIVLRDSRGGVDFASYELNVIP